MYWSDELQSFHQFRQRDVQRLGNHLDVPQGEVPFSPFDSADVGPVETTGGRKGFLGIALLLPQDPHPLSEPLQNVCSLRHASIEQLTIGIIPRTISTISN